MARTILFSSLIALLVLPSLLFSQTKETSQVKQKSIYDFTMKTIDGKERSLGDYKGDVLLVVNVASFCGFTPQYKDLEQVYEKYKGKGFRILAFPANNFGKQEPGSDTEIKTFARRNTMCRLISSPRSASKGTTSIRCISTSRRIPRSPGTSNGIFRSTWSIGKGISWRCTHPGQNQQIRPLSIRLNLCSIRVAKG